MNAIPATSNNAGFENFLAGKKISLTAFKKIFLDKGMERFSQLLDVIFALPVAKVEKIQKDIETLILKNRQKKKGVDLEHEQAFAQILSTVWEIISSNDDPYSEFSVSSRVFGPTDVTIEERDKLVESVLDYVEAMAKGREEVSLNTDFFGMQIGKII